VVADRTDLATHKKPYAHMHAPVTDFVAAIEQLQPTAIIGVAATGGAFTEKVLRTMVQLNTRPIIFALSNPTSKSECAAEQAYRGTDGHALFASGSPLDPVMCNGRNYVPRQANNSYVFPGVGLGAIVSRAREVTEVMFLAAARSLASQVSKDDLAQRSLCPPLKTVRDVSAHIGAAVAEVAYARGLAGKPRPADVLADVRKAMYEPVYASYA